MSEKCLICDADFEVEGFTESEIVRKKVNGKVQPFCGDDCADEIQKCVVCGWEQEDRVCSEECGHANYYGVPLHEDTPSLEPAWWTYR